MSKFKMSNVLGCRIVYNIPFSKRLCRFDRVKNLLSKRSYHRATNYHRFNGFRPGWFAAAGAFVTATGAIYWLKARHSSVFKQTSFVLSAASGEDEEVPEVQMDLTLKRMKFEEYASYEYGGKRLMSPQDFLNSLVDNKEGDLNLSWFY
jgi:hypothetical protein